MSAGILKTSADTETLDILNTFQYEKKRVVLHTVTSRRTISFHALFESHLLLITRLHNRLHTMEGALSMAGDGLLPDSYCMSLSFEYCRS